MLLLVVGCSTKEIYSHEIGEQHADWPIYNIHEMLSGETDLIVSVYVESLKEVPDTRYPDDPTTHQKAILSVDHFFYGEDKSEHIMLYQSVDKVKANTNYLLFLSYVPSIGGYVVSDGTSQSMVSTNPETFHVNVQGKSGSYSKEELQIVLDEAVKKLKQSFF